MTKMMTDECVGPTRHGGKGAKRGRETQDPRILNYWVGKTLEIAEAFL